MIVLKKILFLLLWMLPVMAIAQQASKGADFFNIANYPMLKNDFSYHMESSYDRSGGNDDGFSGKYSVIRKENNKAVIADLKGAGTITRIWFPSGADYPEGPMGLRNKRIYIYLDGSKEPVIDMPVIEMFNNTNRQFPYPLCGMSLGGCWSYLPISYNNGAVVMVEGDSARFFQLQYNSCAAGKFNTFTKNAPPLIYGYKKLYDAMWHLGDISKIASNASAITKRYILKKGNNELSFLQGGAVLRGIIVKGDADEINNFLKGDLSIYWDGDTSPAVQTPLSLFFIREQTGMLGKSLMAGTLHGGGGVYNFFPMPYRKSAKMVINAPSDCMVEISTFLEQSSSADELAYLHIHHSKDYPTKPGKTHVFADVDGEGHYAGTYLRAAGKSLSDSSNGILYWTGCLEGDEVFEVDGAIVEHGTGTEDYFNAGWNGMQLRLDRAGYLPLHGFTLFDAGKDSSYTAAYRWRLPGEVIPFKKHFRATIEVGPVDDYTGNYESISYFYLKDPGDKKSSEN